MEFGLTEFQYLLFLGGNMSVQMKPHLLCKASH
jgi:hypothetical protein